MNDDVEPIMPGWLENLLFEGQEKLGRILGVFVFVDPGTDDIDMPVFGSILNGLRIPVFIFIAPVGTNEIDSPKANGRILSIKDLCPLCVERGDGIQMIFLGEVKAIEAKLRRYLFVSEIEQRTKDENDDEEDLETNKESFHRLIVA